MENNPSSEAPNISGVPEEVQKNIIEDLNQAADANSKGAVSPRIGISVSDNEDLAVLGFSAIHLKDLTIEMVRHLLINNITVIYGGDLRKEGYTELFADLAYQYRSINDPKKIYFKNYFAYPIYCQVTKQHELEFKRNRAEIIKVFPPDHLDVDREVYLPPATLEAKYIWSQSLTKMRTVMISNSDGRILVGGKCDNYLGKMPGILEEAMITLEQKKPLYLLGALGGASLQVINALEGKQFSYINSSYHQSTAFKEFQSFYKEETKDDSIDPDKWFSFFAGLGVESLSRVNGLSVAENKRLFQTPHISEMLYYIFKGLSNCLREKG